MEFLRLANDDSLVIGDVRDEGRLRYSKSSLDGRFTRNFLHRSALLLLLRSLEKSSVDPAFASSLDNEVAMLWRLLTLATELCIPISEIDSILSRTLFCFSISDSDAAVPILTLLSSSFISTIVKASIVLATSQSQIVVLIDI